VSRGPETNTAQGGGGELRLLRGMLRVGQLRLRYTPPQLRVADSALRLESRVPKRKRDFGETKFRRIV
jgi:hypothetical protein